MVDDGHFQLFTVVGQQRQHPYFGTRSGVTHGIAHHVLKGAIQQLFMPAGKECCIRAQRNLALLHAGLETGIFDYLRQQLDHIQRFAIAIARL
ncbi:hypothetical protein D3C79_910910 [compost metagenome]